MGANRVPEATVGWGRASMSDVFISYARSTAKQAQQVAEALRALGYGVWRDDELPAHRDYSEVIEERLRAAKAVVVIWSAEAVKSQWVRAEADIAREAGTLVQLNLDGAALPMPFSRVQCADLTGWAGDLEAPGWKKVADSVAELAGRSVAPPVSRPEASLPLPSKPSIAVMPFANLSGDPEQDYFADGMVVEISEALSRSRSIFVIASGSSLSFKGKGVTAGQAARQLGVRYVLEGNVRKAGGRVRIGVQLIDPEHGAPIWTHRFEDTLEDLFALQDKVALAVAGAIEPTVREAEIRRLSTRPTDHTGSYDLYLRAMSAHRSGAKTGILLALDFLDRAIALDPAYGPALALAAHCHRMIYIFGWTADPQAHRRRGLALADRALKAAGDDPEVLSTVANVLTFLGGEPDVAVTLIDRALALNPGSSRAWFMSGPMRLRIGDTERAVADLETALRLDPVGPFRAVQIGFLGQARLQQGRFGDAVTLLRESLQELENARCYAFLAACLGHLGRAGEAKVALARYHDLTDQPVVETARLFMSDPAQLQLVVDGVAVAVGPGHG